MSNAPAAPLQSQRPLRPQAFGKYLLLERVAVGGMAEVFRAKLRGNDLAGRYIAIKRILPNVSEDQEFIDMFIDEAKIAGQLHHSTICPIYELGRLGPTYYMALEFVAGRDVLQIINRFRRMRERTPPVMGAWIASKVCEALAYAHERKNSEGVNLNIIHRDVSPQNILVSYEGTVKLIDFGISKAVFRTTQTQAGVLKGKFGYMSPEQLKTGNADQRSDLFALGVTLYETLVCDRLFAADGDFATMEKTRTAKVTPLVQVIPGFPPELDQIILRALSPDPNTRWQSAAELGQALKAFLVKQEAFGTSSLARWMKTAFAKELSEEQLKEQNWVSGAIEALGVEPDPYTPIESGPLHSDVTVVQDPGFVTRVTPSETEAGSSYIFFHQQAPEQSEVVSNHNRQARHSDDAGVSRSNSQRPSYASMPAPGSSSRSGQRDVRKTNSGLRKLGFGTLQSTINLEDSGKFKYFVLGGALFFMLLGALLAYFVVR